MSVKANKAENGLVYLEITIEAPPQEVIGDDGKVTLSNYFTPDQWNKLIALDGENVIESQP